MAWIENTNDATSVHYDDDVLGCVVEDPVEDLPGDERGVVWDGPLQVADDVGEALVAHYDTIRLYEADTNST